MYFFGGQFELAGQEGRIRRVADGQEEAGDFQRLFGLADGALEADAGDAVAVVAQDLLDRAVPGDVDFRVVHGPFGHDF